MALIGSRSRNVLFESVTSKWILGVVAAGIIGIVSGYTRGSFLPVLFTLGISSRAATALRNILLV